MNRHHLDSSAADATNQAQWLSAAMDGELSAREIENFQQLCADASTETAVLRQWHSYTAIGEALRETNARCAVRDSGDFVLQIRQRLQVEEQHHCSVQWLAQLTGSHADAAVAVAANEARFWKRAAGFCSLAAVAACGALLWFSQAGAPPSALMAATGDTEATGTVVQGLAVTDAAEVPVSGAAVAGQWEADDRWREYLRTHRQYAGDPYWSDRRGAAVQRTGYQSNR